MVYVKDYILQNWALVLVLLAFAISLKITVFLDRKAIRRMYFLIIAIFLLSVVVFVEFAITEIPELRNLRIALMCIRYSASPFIIALVTYTLIKRQRWFIFIPAMALTILDFVSIFVPIVFGIDADNKFFRGPLGVAPFVVAGLYCAFLIYILIKRSNKRLVEIIPILFLVISFLAGLLLPFVFGTAYANLFCTNIGIALFVYYEFSILQQTKKDSLTGLLNRYAYYAEVSHDPETISAILSIDMNGLKVLNDTQGHAAGDEALITLGLCLSKALRRNQSGYRIGGDEFLVTCRKNTKEEVMSLVDRIKSNVAETQYSCSIGYCFNGNGDLAPEDMLRISDEMMYADKSRYYQKTGIDRRTH